MKVTSPEDEDFCLLGRLLIFRCYLSFEILFIECTTDKLLDKTLVDSLEGTSSSFWNVKQPQYRGPTDEELPGMVFFQDLSDK